MNERPGHSLVTRILHLGLSIGVTLQLLFSTFMQRPKPGVEHPWIEASGFELHEVVGLLILPLVIAWFAWLLVRQEEVGARALFPWFSALQRRALLDAGRRSIAAVRREHMPDPNDGGLIARATHGLGALCALSMALTGTLIWLGMSAQGDMPDWALPILEIHQVLSSFMWAYLVGHAAMAWLHHYRGEETIRRMFSLQDRGRPGA
jgi:cytochrome b561